MIVIGGMIGIGKTTTARTLSESLSLPVFYESVSDNKVLPLFYKASEQELKEKRYPFLLQLNFLSSRFHSIQSSMKHHNAILDRSIFEDRYFCKRNQELGRISDLEMEVYDSFFERILESVPQKTKNETLMIYLKGSFDTILSRIMERGRDFEIDDSLKQYYRFLYDGYDEIIRRAYLPSQLFVVDVDCHDINRDPRDKEWFLDQVARRLAELEK